MRRGRPRKNRGVNFLDEVKAMLEPVARQGIHNAQDIALQRSQMDETNTALRMLLNSQQELQGTVKELAGHVARIPQQIASSSSMPVAVRGADPPVVARVSDYGRNTAVPEEHMMVLGGWKEMRRAAILEDVEEVFERLSTQGRIGEIIVPGKRADLALISFASADLMWGAIQMIKQAAVHPKHSHATLWASKSRTAEQRERGKIIAAAFRCFTEALREEAQGLRDSLEANYPRAKIYLGDYPVVVLDPSNKECFVHVDILSKHLRKTATAGLTEKIVAAVILTLSCFFQHQNLECMRFKMRHHHRNVFQLSRGCVAYTGGWNLWCLSKQLCCPL